MSLLRAISDRVFGFDVFISYSRQDGNAYAHQLNAELTRIGYRTFPDTKEMPPGEPLTTSLRNALARSSALVLIVSPGGLTSTYMPKEHVELLGQPQGPRRGGALREEGRQRAPVRILTCTPISSIRSFPTLPPPSLNKALMIRYLYLPSKPSLRECHSAEHQRP